MPFSFQSYELCDYIYSDPIAVAYQCSLGVSSDLTEAKKNFCGICGGRTYQKEVH